jgi:hypothetical protein
VDREADLPTLLTRQRRPRGGDVLGTRIEGVHRRCACSSERSQTSLAAANLEQAFPIEWDVRGDRRRLYSIFVALLHSLGPRLVGLDGRAAGAELLRLAACVFELGSGVGVDELAGLDPLEPVTL